MADNPIEWWRWVLMAALFAALFGMWWWVNRDKFSLKKLMEPPVSRIKVVERQWVSHQLTLFLIELDGERFLLARTPGSLSWQKVGEAAKPEKRA